MTDNPYKPPTSSVAMPDMRPEVPAEVAKKIKNCWMAGIVSIVVTITFVLISMYGTSVLGLNAWSFIDVVLMSIFTFGIYKKSRVCAVLMLIFFVANKVIMTFGTGSPSGLPLALVFLWFYAQGVVGTFQFHNLKKLKSAPLENKSE